MFLDFHDQKKRVNCLFYLRECFRRVEQLRDRQEIRKDKLKEAMTRRVTQTKEEDDIGSNDEGELQDLLSQDWRAKGTVL